MNPTTTITSSRKRRLAVTGVVVAAGLSIAGAGAAMAVDAPEADEGVTSQPETPAVAVDTVAVEAQLEAFFAAGHTYDDAVALSDLWNVDVFETKVQAGQVLLDGAGLPVAPGSAAPAVEDLWEGLGITQEQSVAFWDAGYTPEDLEALNALWGTDSMETKARAGQLLVDGQDVPVAPSAEAVATDGL